jgi:hypothetical protein
MSSTLLSQHVAIFPALREQVALYLIARHKKPLLIPMDGSDVSPHVPHPSRLKVELRRVLHSPRWQKTLALGVLVKRSRRRHESTAVRFLRAHSVLDHPRCIHSVRGMAPRPSCSYTRSSWAAFHMEIGRGDAVVFAVCRHRGP